MEKLKGELKCPKCNSTLKKYIRKISYDDKDKKIWKYILYSETQIVFGSICKKETYTPSGKKINSKMVVKYFAV